MSSASHCLLNNFSKFDKRIRLAYRFNNLFAEFIHMRSGKDGEYYFVTIESDEELEKLKELTLKKIRARNGKLSYASQSSK
jgi:hypothetical protein